MEPAAELVVDTACGDGRQPCERSRSKIRMPEESVREERLRGWKIVETGSLALPLRLRLEREPRAVQNAATEFLERTRFRTARGFGRGDFRRDLVRQL